MKKNSTKSTEFDSKCSLIVIIALCLLACLASCSTESSVPRGDDSISHTNPSKPFSDLMDNTLPYKKVRAKCLENNTITFVTLDMDESRIYRPRDTVWLNYDTHRISDTDSTAMMVVLYSPN